MSWMTGLALVLLLAGVLAPPPGGAADGPAASPRLQGVGSGLRAEWMDGRSRQAP